MRERPRRRAARHHRHHRRGQRSGGNGTATATITAIDNNFEAQTTTVTAGTTITFENGGRNTHNVVPEGDPKATTWGALDAAFAPKATYSHTFDTPGTYVYYCTIHGTPSAGMFGTIIVTAP